MATVILPLVILGHGGHAVDIHDIAVASRMFQVIEFLDDMLPEHRPCSAPFDTTPFFVIGVNNPQVRASLDRRDLPAATLVHPTAAASTYATLGPGCVVAAKSYLGPRVRLGRHVHIGVGVNVASRSTIGDYCTISPGATICGDTEIGERTWIGAGAVMANLVQIGRDVIVGAGAVLPPGTVVPDGVTVAGVPAKELSR